MTLIASLLSIIFALLAAFLWQKGKTRTAEAILENLDTKNKLNGIDQTIIQNAAKLATEEERRKYLEEQLKTQENKNVSVDDLLKFLNTK